MTFSLFQTCMEGNLERVKYHYEAGVDFRECYVSVQYASRYGYLEMVKYLCEAGSDFRSDNDLAVRMASEIGHIEVVKYLCEAGADIRSDNDFAIRMASLNGHLEVVKYLVSLGADNSKISENHQKYIAFCEKMKNKIRERAQKKIYFWWIPICYDTTRDCGKRMMLKNLEKAKELGLELRN